MIEEQQTALRNAAEQFVAAHADGAMDAELLAYFEDIFREALALDPEWLAAHRP